LTNLKTTVDLFTKGRYLLNAKGYQTNLFTIFNVGDTYINGTCFIKTLSLGCQGMILLADHKLEYLFSYMGKRTIFFTDDRFLFSEAIKIVDPSVEIVETEDGQQLLALLKAQILPPHV